MWAKLLFKKCGRCKASGISQTTMGLTEQLLLIGVVALGGVFGRLNCEFELESVTQNPLVTDVYMLKLVNPVGILHIVLLEALTSHQANMCPTRFRCSTEHAVVRCTSAVDPSSLPIASLLQLTVVRVSTPVACLLWPEFED